MVSANFSFLRFTNSLCRRFVAKLPDKGERIIRFRDAILKEIEHRNEIDRAANLLSRLNIASEGKAAMSTLEWTGKLDEKSSSNKVVELDSDDEDDPLKILAQVTVCSNACTEPRLFRSIRVEPISD